MPDLTKLAALKYGGKCGNCGELVPKGSPAYFGDGIVYHIECIKMQEGPEEFEARVMDYLELIHALCVDNKQRLNSIYEKTFPATAPTTPTPSVPDLMGGKK